jgi:hypothetical protein
MVDPSLDKFFRFLGEQGIVDRVEARKYIKKMTSFSHYAHSQMKGLGAEKKIFNIYYEMFINDDDLPTIFNRYINSPNIQRVGISEEQYDLIRQGKLTPEEVVDPRGSS